LDLPVRSNRAVPSEKLTQFLGRQRIETPYLIVELDVVAERFSMMRRLLPNAAIHYAVKANPERKLLELLWAMGANFDASSVAEIKNCLSVGASPEQISYGNTIKKARDIACAYQLGVRMFSFDSFSELKKLAFAPGPACAACQSNCGGTAAEPEFVVILKWRTI
jgi:ornithine decarboxylase